MYMLLIYSGQYRNWTLQNKNLKSLFQNSNKHILNSIFYVFHIDFRR